MLRTMAVKLLTSAMRIARTHSLPAVGHGQRVTVEPHWAVPKSSQADAGSTRKRTGDYSDRCLAALVRRVTDLEQQVHPCVD